MIFEIRLTNKATKAISKLDGKLKGKIQMLFKHLQSVQIPSKEYDLKKIEGEEETYRIRISSFRIIYRIKHDLGIIEILKVERRSETTYS